MGEQQHFLTPEGAERLREELKHLKGPQREELAKRLRSAIQMGDLSENFHPRAEAVGRPEGASAGGRAPGATCP